MPISTKAPVLGPVNNGRTGGASTSQVLADFVAAITTPSVTIRELANVMGKRAFGGLLLVFALPNLIPIPGISTIFGVLIGLMAVQLVLGRRTLWLPRAVATHTIGRDSLASVIKRATPHLERSERWLRPRLFVLCTGPAERLIGLVCLAMALILVLPLVLNNLLPAIAVSAFALGLIERDGIAVLVGYVVSVLSVIIFALTLLVGTAATVGLFKAALYIFYHAQV